MQHYRAGTSSWRTLQCQVRILWSILWLLTLRSHRFTTEHILGRREDHPYIRLHQALTSFGRLPCM